MNKASNKSNSVKNVKQAPKDKDYARLINGDTLKHATKIADAQRLQSGLSEANPNTLGNVNQNHGAGFDIAIDKKNTLHYESTGKNGIVNVAKVLDDTQYHAVPQAKTLAHVFSDKSIFTTRFSVLIADSDDAMVKAIASTKENPQDYVAFVKAARKYFIGQHGEVKASETKQAAKKEATKIA